MTGAEQNLLLRRVDWRFLLSQPGRPRVLNLAAGQLAKAVALVADPAPQSTNADLVTLSSPSFGQLQTAFASLRPGGELYCEWTRPAPGRAERVRRALTRAGFTDIRLLWPGPRAFAHPPQFWLPLDSQPATEHLLADRPARSWQQIALRRAWRVAARGGALAPLCVLATRRGEPGPGQGLPTGPCLLLTGGHRVINKVVALPFAGGQTEPPQLVVKFARVPEAEPALVREETVLRAMAEKLPENGSVPRVLATANRAGAHALAESAIHGTLLMSELTASSFPRLAAAVTQWLIGLVPSREALPRERWWERLVERPLATFEEQFGAALKDGELIAKTRSRLEALGPLPSAFEHRDCSPWNVILTPDRWPALLDWESAEPSGLPALDLIYFLANAAFVLEGAIESNRTRESYTRLLDTDTATGRTASECLETYCRAVDVDPQQLPALRALTWIVHTPSDYRHLLLEGSTQPTQDALRAAPFLGLLEQELV